MASRQLPLTLLAVTIGLVLKELDFVALRVAWYEHFQHSPSLPEPHGCQRLRGPIGAEDAVLLQTDPPILITGELDALAHEFTNQEDHGISASSSPPGSLWAIDRLAAPTPRLTRLQVPLPDGVTTLHSEHPHTHPSRLSSPTSPRRRRSTLWYPWRSCVDEPASLLDP